eukprot:2580405-Rhodomonas_salina.1
MGHCCSNVGDYEERQSENANASAAVTPSHRPRGCTTPRHRRLRCQSSPQRKGKSAAQQQAFPKLRWLKPGKGFVPLKQATRATASLELKQCWNH